MAETRTITAPHSTKRSAVRESGITINPTKSEFNKLSIEFYVYIFSDEGLAPAPEKGKALQDVA